MKNDRIHMGWLESDDNLKLWYKKLCPYCDHTIKIDIQKINNDDKVYCLKCGKPFLYQFGHFYQEEANIQFPHGYLPEKNPLNKEIATFFDIFVNVVGNIKSENTDLRKIFSGIKFVIGHFDYEMDAHATRSYGINVVYVSRMLIQGLYEFFLSICSQESFIFSEFHWIDRRDVIQIIPNRTPKEILEMYKKGKDFNLAGALGGSKIDFVKPINYIIYKYFKFLSFSFILLHEIGHIEMGHLKYAEERMGIRKLYGAGSNVTNNEVFQAFEVAADVQSSVTIYYLTRMVTLDDRFKKVIGNDFEVNLPDDIAVFLSSLMNVYVALIVPYYLSFMFPVEEEMSHPPAILRSFFCRNGLYLDNGFRDMIHENEFKAMVASWDWYENQLLSSDYCGEKELVNTSQWKDRKDKFGFYMELLINLKMPLGFTYDNN